MLKENADHKKVFKCRRNWRLLPQRASRRNGMVTNYGFKQFQNRFVMEGNNNLLFGTRNGSPVGLCLKNCFTNRNLNTLVLSGNTYKGWTNYTLPNLLAGHSSAVVVGDDPKFVLPTALSKGINVYLVSFDLNNDDTPTNRYNLFRVHEPKNASLAMRYLADVVSDLFNKAHKTDDGADRMGVYKDLLYYIFLYVCMSSDLSESERSFKTVKAVIDDLMEGGKPSLSKYLIKDAEDCTSECLLERIMKECDDGILHIELSLMLIDLQPLIYSKAFEPDSESAMNISVEKLVKEKTYLFIKRPVYEWEGKATSLFLTMLIKELYAYGEKNWAHSDQALENPVHFYLEGIPQYRVYNFLTCLATCRPYGIGFSIISEMWRLKKCYEKNDEWKFICAGVDSQVFLSTGREGADTKYIQDCLPVQCDKDGKEIPERRLWKWQRERRSWISTHLYYRTRPALSEEELEKLFSEDKAIVVVRDRYPIVCDVLKPDDYRNSEAKVGMIIDEGRNLAE